MSAPLHPLLPSQLQSPWEAEVELHPEGSASPSGLQLQSTTSVNHATTLAVDLSAIWQQSVQPVLGGTGSVNHATTLTVEVSAIRQYQAVISTASNTTRPGTTHPRTTFCLTLHCAALCLKLHCPSPHTALPVPSHCTARPLTQHCPSPHTALPFASPSASASPQRGRRVGGADATSKEAAGIDPDKSSAVSSNSAEFRRPLGASSI